MPRTAAERRADAIAKLENDGDVWIATGDAHGHPHLVPLSLLWDGRRIIVATLSASPTARNATASGRARLALGDTRDVVMIDATAEVVPLPDTPPDVVEAFVRRCQWDPRRSQEPYSFLFLSPRRVQVWRDEPEIAGRTVMRGGQWL
jgi:hypothetical protein